MSEHTHHSLICIGCPLGCLLDVEEMGEGAWKTKGYQCKKGKEYGVQEVTDPRRMVTTTVAIRGAHWARLPVRSTAEVPKDLVIDFARALPSLCVQSPVKVGQILMENVIGTGVDVMATRSM